MFDPGKSGMGQHSKCPDHLAAKKIAARKAKNSIARGSRVNAGGLCLPSGEAGHVEYGVKVTARF